MDVINFKFKKLMLSKQIYFFFSLYLLLQAAVAQFVLHVIHVAYAVACGVQVCVCIYIYILQGLDIYTA